MPGAAVRFGAAVSRHDHRKIAVQHRGPANPAARGCLLPNQSGSGKRIQDAFNFAEQ